jgi:epsilon-lactone hydrolase
MTMPSKEHEAVVEMLVASRLADVPSVEEQRAAFDTTLAATPIPPDIRIDPLKVDGLDCDWVTTPRCREDRVILYLHGGGYAIGSNVGYREFAGRIARAVGARVCLPNYRLAPEHPFPAAVDDAVTVYEWLLSQRIDPRHLAIGGDSAGGGLTLATLLALRDEGRPMPACAAVFSPWTDLAVSGASARPGAVDDPLIVADAIEKMADYYAKHDKRNPLASPLYGDLTGLPPLLIQTGSREALRDDSRRLVDKARNAGVDVEYFEGDGLIHVWPLFASTAPETADALERMAKFIGQHLKLEA